MVEPGHGGAMDSRHFWCEGKVRNGVPVRRPVPRRLLHETIIGGPLRIHADGTQSS